MIKGASERRRGSSQCGISFVPGGGEARAKNVLFIFRAGDGLETILAV